MKESNSMRQGYGTSRDLDVVLEENEAVTTSGGGGGMSYLDGVLDPLPSSLSFLRAMHSKASTGSVSAFHNDNTMERPSLPMRRARAGTMPSLVHSSMPADDRTHRSPLLRPAAPPTTHHPPQQQHTLSNPSIDTRHRSGSLNLPIPPPMHLSFDSGLFGWQDEPPSKSGSQLPSPSTEQLLRGDSDFSIARTLRSLGLEDDHRIESSTSTPFHPMHHHQQHPSPPPAPSGRSLLSNTSSRSRSYSVNAAARYQDTTTTTAPPPSTTTTRARTTSMSRSFVQNRPRASSMGRMDYGRPSPPVPSSLWQMHAPLETLTDDEYDEDKSHGGLSLGDSELLANLIQKQQHQQQHQQQPTYEETTNGMTSAPTNHGAIAEPYLHFSQSTPTFRNQPQMTTSTSSPTQAATRSLWIGNVDATVSVDNLTQMFSVFGPIESVRLLLEKECAFVNFFHVEDAIRAKEEVLGRLGGRVGNCIVRIGFGRADAAVPDTSALQPTRALWLGNIPPGTAPSALQHMFSPFGIIESVRVLSHKNCGFVNFELVESAAKARDALLQNEIGSQGFAGVRVGFAKVPPPKSQSTEPVHSPSSPHQAPARSSQEIADNEAWLAELWAIMQDLGADAQAKALLKPLEQTSSYFDSIPPVPELGANRKFDAGRLRDLRKKLDNAGKHSKEVEQVAHDCLDEIAELSSDYIGNTVVQRLFEKCTEETKTAMLERIAPHLASIGVHKNGTWAAQKIIDTIKTPAQIRLVCTHMKPYVPPLLLDQFGNYAVQCCLRLSENQFIFDAMVEKLVSIAQGRFGARAMRGTLENQNVTPEQQLFVAASLVLHAPSLSLNANGTLLLSWLIDSSGIAAHRTLAAHLAPTLATVATHKLGSQMLLKLFSQDPDARALLLDALLDEACLQAVLNDQVRGLSLVQKLLASHCLSADQTDRLNLALRPLLTTLQGAGHKKLLDELDN